MRKYLFAALLFFLGGNIILAQTAINFEVRNAQQNGSHYDFDVYTSASHLGTLNARGQVYIDYNSAAFGTNALANQKVMVTLTGILNQNEPQTGLAKYSIVNLTDNDLSRFAITWQSNFLSFPASNAFQSEVPAMATPIAHVRMTFTDQTQAPNISFHNGLMAQQQYYVLANSTSETAYANQSSLPVELLDFNAVQSGPAVQLDWTTTTELNNSHFELEKAIDGNDFIKIETVKGQGTSLTSTRYSFLDQTDMGTINTYRLKQVDMDGAYTYSEKVEVLFEESTEMNISVYPVPARESINVEIQSAQELETAIEIFDVSGKMVWRGTRNLGQSSIQINILDLPAGTYSIKTKNSLGQQVTNFIKIN